MDDNEIIKLFSDRDESAIEQTRLKYGAKCMSVAFGILRNAQDAEEAVSDAYLSVWNSIPPEHPDIFPAYLFRIVRNQALMKLNFNNALKRRGVAVQLDELEECLPSEFDVEQAFDERQLSVLINTFLKTLPIQQRRIFICRYFAGLEYKEISKKLGIGLSRVKMSALRSREKLKELLIKEGYNG